MFICWCLCLVALLFLCRRLPGNMGGMAPQMALAYQLQNMGISGPPRGGPNNPMGGMQMMPPGYGAAGASAAAPMAVIGTDSKTIKVRGLPFRCAIFGLKTATAAAPDLGTLQCGQHKVATLVPVVHLGRAVLHVVCCCTTACTCPVCPRLCRSVSPLCSCNLELNWLM